MSGKLHAEDARVVDMLLDSGNFATDASVPQVFNNTEMLNNRFVQVEKVLKLLEEMPVSDPPSNLVARTMSFIDQAAQHPHVPGTVQLPTQRPSA